MNEKRSILIHGRLGKNPDLRYTKKRVPVCELALAESVDGQENPIWHKVVVWGKQAELCSVHLKKGSELFVRGQNAVREFTNEKGEKKQYSELMAEFLGFSLV